MNLIQLNRALKQLRLGGVVEVLETQLQQAQAESMAYVFGAAGSFWFANFID
jgi:hypothetical protein